MIDLYYWTTPNGHKISLFLEETGLPYRVHPINIGKDEQFQPHFLKISPNNRIPAIVDQEPADDGEPLSLFESGAILLYLAEKTGRFIPQDLRGRQECLQWLFWQMGGLGPMAGQNHHFNRFAPEKLPYAIQRYVKETARLYGVLDKRLADRSYIAGSEYSIADMAIYPWIDRHLWQEQNLDDFPNLKRWYLDIQARPATVRAYALVEQVNPTAVKK
ncbi:glutathione binding-like protein [Pseudomonas sp. OTU5201]|uniref:glutathione binding-like protein n=1 Tax=Pseudomonas sp. OTU5201 TaxID=3043850 RepID=UPI00313CA68F